MQNIIEKVVILNEEIGNVVKIGNNRWIIGMKKWEKEGTAI